MKILLVSYFFEPNTNVASQRWSRYFSYLKKNHEIKVWTGPWSDHSNDEKTYISDPFSEDAAAFESGKTVKDTVKQGFLSKYVKPIFIDGKIFWSKKVALKLLFSKRVDLVIVTGSPWSTVVCVSSACFLKRQKFVVDFRDFWAAERFNRYGSAFARKYFKALEILVMKMASGMITVNDVLLDYFSKMNDKIPSVALPNGFEGEVSYNSSEFNSTAQKKFQILYAGSISARSGVSDYLEMMGKCATPVDTRFMGTDHESIFSKNSNALLPFQKLEDAEIVMQSAAVLLLTLDREARNYTTGKLLTYLKVGRPILYYGPIDSPAAKMISDLGVGWIVANGDLVKFTAVMNEIKVHCGNQNPFSFSPAIERIKYFSLDSLGARLDACLKTINEP